MAGTNLLGSWFINASCEGDVSLFEIIFCNSLDLFKNVLHFEISGCLRKGSLTDIVNLLKIKNSVENSLCLVESLFWNLLSLSI